MRDPGTSTWTFYEPEQDEAELAPTAPRDALTAPRVEALLPSGLALWPRGGAWGTPDAAAPDHGSVLAAFTRALLLPFSELYARAWRLTEESRASTLVDSLGEWERDFGLPDACGTPADSISARRRALLTKVRGAAVLTPQDFVRLAHDEGFTVAIEEPAGFECGFSECGGAHEVGDPRQDAYWFVHVYDLAIDFFHVGESEVGADPLFEVVGADRLACLFDRYRPAWSKPVFITHD